MSFANFAHSHGHLTQGRALQHVRRDQREPLLQGRQAFRCVTPARVVCALSQLLLRALRHGQRTTSDAMAFNAGRDGVMRSFAARRRKQVSSIGGSAAGETLCTFLAPYTDSLQPLYRLSTVRSTAPIQTLYIPSAFYRPSGSLPQSITDPLQALYKLYSLYSPVEPPRAQASEQQRRQRSWRDPLQILSPIYRFSTGPQHTLDRLSTAHSPAL